VLFLGKSFERIESLVPQLGEVVAQKREPLGIQFVDPARSFAAVAHQASLFQHPQVLRNRGPRHGKSRRQFVHGTRMRPDHLKNGQAGGVAERGEAVA